LLISAPFAIAYGNFKTSALSQNPKVEQFFLPWWSSFFSTLIFSLVCLFSQTYLPTDLNFWCIALGVSGFSNVMSWLLKVLAYKHDRVSRVSTIFYLEAVFGLFLDYFAFNVTFNLL
jgi:drug/metabolite transporter (DMT)-like permease